MNFFSIILATWSVDATIRKSKAYYQIQRWTQSATITEGGFVIFYRKSPRDVWNRNFELQNEDETDLENKLSLAVIRNRQICKNFYNTLHNSTAGNLR